jgi:hypothetical protein
MRRERCICNHDCFHCPYSDCKAYDYTLTPWERKVYKNAHGGWEGEAIAEKVSRMLAFGVDRMDIICRLNISQSQYGVAIRRIKNASHTV